MARVFGMIKIDKASTDKCNLMRSLGHKPRTGRVKTCICGNDFYVRPSAVKDRNYCSRGCASKGACTAISKNCTVCSIEYTVTASQERHRGLSRFCSKKCRGVYMSSSQLGDKNPSWAGGVSGENHRVRQSKKFKLWRKAVFDRDDYTCQFCGVRGGYLEPDHIKPFAYFKEYRFDVSNGRTLCKPCHKTTDTYGWRAKKLYALCDQDR